jgi:hypothetical protein
MDDIEFDDYVSYAVILLGMTFFAVLATKYMSYWKQLREAISRSGMKWPPHSQEELNAMAQTDLLTGYKMMATNFGAVARVIFTMQTDDPLVRKPLRGIRVVLFAFILFPILFILALVMTLAFLAT